MKTLEAKSLQDLRSRLDRLEAQSGQSGQSGPEGKEQFVGKCVNILEKVLKRIENGTLMWLALFVSLFFYECEVTPARTTCFSVMYMLDIEKAVPQGDSRNRAGHHKPSRSIQSMFQFVAGHTAIGAQQHRGRKKHQRVSKLEWLAEVWNMLSSVLETWITVELSYTCHRCRGKVLAAFEQQIGPAWGTIRARHENIATCCEGIFR